MLPRLAPLLLLHLIAAAAIVAASVEWLTQVHMVGGCQDGLCWDGYERRGWWKVYALGGLLVAQAAVVFAWAFWRRPGLRAQALLPFPVLSLAAPAWDLARNRPPRRGGRPPLRR